MTVTLGALAVVAAVVALLARRLEHVGVLVGLVAGVLSLDLLARGEVGVATGLIAGGGVMAAIVLAAVAVIEVDARPPRRLQPWKVLLLLPLAFGGGLATADGAGAGPPGRSAAGALLVVGLTALGIPLLVRRASQPSEPRR